MASSLLSYFFINFAQVTAGVGVSLRSFYQLQQKVRFSLVLIRVSCCFPLFAQNKCNMVGISLVQITI